MLCHSGKKLLENENFVKKQIRFSEKHLTIREVLYLSFQVLLKYFFISSGILFRSSERENFHFLIDEILKVLSNENYYETPIPTIVTLTVQTFNL